MSGFLIELHWQRSAPNLHSAKYSNAHTVRYNENGEMQVDAAEMEEMQKRAHPASASLPIRSPTSSGSTL